MVVEGIPRSPLLEEEGIPQLDLLEEDIPLLWDQLLVPLEEAAHLKSLLQLKV